MKCTKTGHRLLLFWVIYFGQTQADVATLYEVSTSATGPATLTSSIEVIQSGTTNVRAIGTGTGADGKPETTYVQDNIVSLYVAKFPSPDDPSKTATTTLISGPQTIAVTFAENQNGYHATRSLSIVSPTHSATGTGTGTGTGPLDFQGGLDEKCVFYANGTGSCVRIDIGLDSATRTTFSTRTYTGTLAPWYTAGKDDVRAATGSQSQTTKPTSNGGGSVRLGRGGRFLGGGGGGLGMLGVVMGVGLSAGLGMLGCVV